MPYHGFQGRPRLPGGSRPRLRSFTATAFRPWLVLVLEEFNSLLHDPEAARLLGVHRATLCRSVDAGLLPLHPIFVTPHLRRFRRDEVESLSGARVPGSATSASTAKGQGRGRS